MGVLNGTGWGEILQKKENEPGLEPVYFLTPEYIAAERRAYELEQAIAARIKGRERQRQWKKRKRERNASMFVSFSGLLAVIIFGGAKLLGL